MVKRTVTTIDPAVGVPLSPITATLAAIRARHGPTATHGLTDSLLVPDPPCWTPATALADGDQLPALLDAAKQRWRATSPAAAALAWKSYTYWLALPAVLGWASARRVPLLDPARVLVRFNNRHPFLTLGLRRPAIAVLPSDPLLAIAGAYPVWDLRIVADEAELLVTLRQTVLDSHLRPVMDQIRTHTRLGRRTLLGSLASGVAHGIIRASDALPGAATSTISTLLDTLGVTDLVSLRREPTGELRVYRHTCCLAFTLPDPKICSGCCIRQA